MIKTAQQAAVRRERMEPCAVGRTARGELGGKGGKEFSARRNQTPTEIITEPFSGVEVPAGWKEENTEMKSNGSQPQTIPGSNASSATCNLSVLNYKLLHLPGL